MSYEGDNGPASLRVETVSAHPPGSKYDRLIARAKQRSGGQNDRRASLR